MHMKSLYAITMDDITILGQYWFLYQSTEHVYLCFILSWSALIKPFTCPRSMWRHTGPDVTHTRPVLTFVLPVANIKWCKKTTEKWLKPWHMGFHLKVFSDSYPINTNMTRFRWFSKILRSCALDEGRKEGIGFYVAFNSLGHIATR